jgi:hypothetical protein
VVVSLLLVAQFLLILSMRATGLMSLLLAVGVVAAAARVPPIRLGCRHCIAGGAPAVVPMVAGVVSRLSLAVYIAATAGVTLALVVGLLMLHSNLSVFEWSSAAFTSEGAHDQSFNELLRIQNFAGGQVPIRIFCLLLIGLCIGGFLVRRDRAPSSGATVLGYACIWACVGLRPPPASGSGTWRRCGHCGLPGRAGGGRADGGGAGWLEA